MCKKVSCLGPEGSYTCLAARAMCKDAQIIPCHNFFGAVELLLSGVTDAAVLPIENTINGGVLQNMDILANYCELTAVREDTMPIDHRLITLKGADLSKISRIFSHRQALDQCSAYLQVHYPDAELVAENSTAASISCLENLTDAAIAGAQCAEGGYEVSPECISDEKNNFTHFLLVIKKSLPSDYKSSKIYFTLTCNNEPGALLKILSVIYKHGINMVKIESRPLRNITFGYRFFMEIEADYSSPDIKNALEEVSGTASSFRVIGAY